MRILIYCDDPGYGGTAVNAGLLAVGLAGDGRTVGLAAAGLHHDVPGVAFVPLDYDTQRLHHKTLASRNEPAAAFLAFRPQLVLFCDSAPDANLAAKAVCLDWGLPYVAVVNYAAPDQAAALEPSVRAAVARTLGAALAVVAVSSENLALLRRDYGLPAKRSGVIYNGRPEYWFAPPEPDRRMARRRELGLGPHDALFLTVARYEPRKGYRHLIAAVRAVWDVALPRRPVFVWIGQSPGDGEMQVRRAVAGLEARVKVLGERDDVRDWLGAADAFVLPSESEGMPLCLIEAMGQGLPVVASDVSGIPELLGDTGILLPNPGRNAEAATVALAQSIVTLAADVPLCRALGRAGRERARAFFSAEAMLAAYKTLLRSLEPAMAGHGRDWAALASAPPANLVPVGREIAWGQDAGCLEYLKEGWSAAEDTGRWTEGDRARLVLALPPALRTGFVLAFEATAFLGADDAGQVTVDITVNGRPAGQARWTGPAVARWVELAVAMPDGADRAEVVLAIAGASSPAAHGLSDDFRMLGLRLLRLRLTPMPRSGGAA